MAISKNDIKTKLAEVAAISNKYTAAPNHVPVGVYIQEAKSLYLWSVQDKEALQGAGLSGELLEDIPLRVEALSETQAALDAVKTKNTTTEAWKALYADAMEFRSELIVVFAYAFRSNIESLEVLREVKKKTSQAEIIQSFMDLSALGECSLELLEAVEFDTSLLDRAASLNQELRDSLSYKLAGMTKLTGAKEDRNKAYTHLKEAVDEVRAAGKFVFRKDDTRLPGYRSRHLRQVRLDQKRKKKAGNTTAATGPGGHPQGDGLTPVDPGTPMEPAGK
ncbi:MAG: hypothetical protein GY765_09135 [bacterium]|nr:hypothetical protein [bacterium]